MQVSSASSSAQQLAITAAKAEGRSQRLVSAEAFGQTRGADRFEKALQSQPTPSTYSFEHAKKLEAGKIDSTQATQETATPDEPQVAETVQFTQNDVDNLLKIFGAGAGDSEFISQYDLDGSGTIDLQDLNAMLAQIGTPPAAESGAPDGFTQDDIDLLLEAFGSQPGDDAYNEALDLDGDGVIGLQDLNTMLASMGQGTENSGFTQAHVDQLTAAFGAQTGDDNFIAELDLNADGTLNLADLNELLASMA